MTAGARTSLVANATMMVAVAPLMRRMRQDLDCNKTLRRSTQVQMWAAYSAFGVLLVDSLTRRRSETPAPVRVAGYSIAIAGAALATAGMSAFASPDQLNGGDTGHLITGGIYDYSRNPQYAGFIAAVSGLAAARRSRRTALLAAELAVVMRSWIGVEEQHLAREFGPAYVHLCRRVPRWIGVPAPVDSAG